MHAARRGAKRRRIRVSNWLAGEDRKTRLGLKGKPSEEELRDTFEATLTLLYRLLFLLYESGVRTTRSSNRGKAAAGFVRHQPENGWP